MSENMLNLGFRRKFSSNFKDALLLWMENVFKIIFVQIFKMSENFFLQKTKPKRKIEKPLKYLSKNNKRLSTVMTF